MVDSTAWRARVEQLAAAYDPLVPVVKGNGYGFGRGPLARIAADLVSARSGGRGRDGAPVVAVGTVEELAGLPPGIRPLVLTPPGPGTAGRTGRGLAARLRSVAAAPILTVSGAAHVRALEGWSGDVLVKLASSMRRFGVTPRELDDLERMVRAAGLGVAGHSIHLPLAGDDGERVAEIDQWVERLDRRTRPAGAEPALWVSHLGPDAHSELRSRWPQWRFPMRIGTALWHGDKAALRLNADVLDVHTVAGGSVGGYHRTRVVRDGTLVVIGAGTAHGVTVLDDGRSPFHFQRRRLALLEPPHMHTSMVFVPTGEPCPAIGDAVDVQRPLISVNVDEVVWS